MTVCFETIEDAMSYYRENRRFFSQDSEEEQLEFVKDLHPYLFEDHKDPQDGQKQSSSADQ